MKTKSVLERIIQYLNVFVIKKFKSHYQWSKYSKFQDYFGTAFAQK